MNPTGIGNEMIQFGLQLIELDILGGKLPAQFNKIGQAGLQLF